MPVDRELLGRIRRQRRVLVESGPGLERDDGDFARVALPDGEGDVLRDLLAAENPRVLIEIGLAYASAALAIAEALVSTGDHRPRQFIVDAYQDKFRDAGWNVLIAAGLADVCELCRERSQLALPRLIADGFMADAAFVDGSHVFHNVFVDLCFLRELVRPGGLIVLDDCGWPPVATAVRYFELNTGWRPEPIGCDTRLRAYRLPDHPVEPRFDDFRPFGSDARH